MSAPTRHSLVAGAAALALAAVTAGTDAALLAACAEMRRAKAKLAALNAKADCTDEEMDPVIDEWWASVDAVQTCPAPTSPRGAAERAAAAFMMLEHGLYLPPGEPWKDSERGVGFAMTVLRDMAESLAGGPAPPPPGRRSMSAPRYIVTVPADHADAALIATCNEALATYWANVRRTDNAPLTDNAAWEVIYQHSARWHDLVARVTFTPATTPEGIRAKAEVLAPVVALQEPLVASLVSDLLGKQVGALTGRGRRRWEREEGRRVPQPVAS